MNPVERWDDWFDLVGDERALREWSAAKSACGGDSAALEGRAAIIELTRLGRMAGTPAKDAGVD